MRPNLRPNHVRLIPLCLLLCGLLAWRVAPLPAQPSDKDAKVEFKYQMAKGEPELSIRGSSVFLRPNTEHGLLLYVKNTETNKEKDAIQGISVSLMRVDTDPPVLVAKAKLEKDDKLRAGEQARIKFEADKALPWIGASPKLQLWLESKNKNKAVQDVTIEFWETERYVKVSKAHYDAATRRISFTVSLQREFVGPPCTVQLVIDPHYFPGLKTFERITREQTLNKIGQGLDLFADLDFEGVGDGPVDPRVFLNIDGYERTLEYRPKFDDPTGNLRLAQYTTEVGVRLRTPRFLPPGDKKNPLMVTLEIDSNPINLPSRVEFGFNKSEGNKEDEKFQVIPQGGYTGLRNISLIVNAGKDGELLTKMTVADWQVPVPTADLLGQRYMRLRILDAKGKKELPISKDALKPLQHGLTGLAPLVLERNQLFSDVTFDGSAVTDIKFTKLPDDLTAGKELEVFVDTKDRDRPEGRYAPVEKAIFYLGKKTEGKIEAEDQVVGKALGKGRFYAKLRTPTVDKESRIEVAVQFKTANGRISTGSDFLILKPFMKGDVVATLKGKVLDTGDKAKTGAIVQLKDAKGKLKDEKTSGEMGVFVFEKVAPGDYTIEARNPIPAGFGRAVVTVPPGKELVEKDVVVKMK